MNVLRAWMGYGVRRWLAAIVVTALTLVLVGAVIATTTSVACGPANKLGLKLSRCTANIPTAAELTPTPTPTIYYRPTPTYYPTAVPQTPTPLPPAPTPASAAEPQDPFYPGGSQMPFAASLHCSLPVYVGPPGSGGFVTLPGGTFVADPRSAVALPSPSPGASSPAPAQGPGYGYGQPYYGMTYDRQHSRWLPVGVTWASPDGNHYAYPSTNGIYLVTAATNTQVELGQGHSWIPLRVLNDRILATIPNAPGFWVVPFAGDPVQVIATGYWQAASATAAYGTSTSAVPAGALKKLMKLDIATGKVSDWFSDDGTGLTVVGFDAAGDPFIQTYYYGNNIGSWVLWLTTGPSKATVIANSSEGMNYLPQGLMVSDSHGVWMVGGSGGNNGLILYARGSGLYWMATVGAQLAGGCD